MVSGPSATTTPAGQARTAASLGGIMHEWRQWLAPGVVVTVVLAMGSLQRADIREFKTDIREDIRKVNDRIDQVDDKVDRVNDRINQLDNRINQLDNRIDRLDNRIDQLNIRMDRIYQLLLP